MEMEIRSLGGFSAHRSGEEIACSAFGGRLARRLLRILLTRRGGFLSRDFLTEALWPRTPPADPVMNLNVLVKRARRGSWITASSARAMACRGSPTWRAASAARSRASRRARSSLVRYSCAQSS